MGIYQISQVPAVDVVNNADKSFEDEDNRWYPYFYHTPEGRAIGIDTRIKDLLKYVSDEMDLLIYSMEELQDTQTDGEDYLSFRKSTLDELQDGFACLTAEIADVLKLLE